MVGTGMSKRSIYRSITVDKAICQTEAPRYLPYGRAYSACVDSGAAITTIRSHLQRLHGFRRRDHYHSVALTALA